MWFGEKQRRFLNFLMVERFYGTKLLLASSAAFMAIWLFFTPDNPDPGTLLGELHALADPMLWQTLFFGYAFTLFYGVFKHQIHYRFIGSMMGFVLWGGIFAYHVSVSGLVGGHSRAVYLVFALFSLWHTITVREELRLMRLHGIDITSVVIETMLRYLRQAGRKE